MIHSIIELNGLCPFSATKGTFHMIAQWKMHENISVKSGEFTSCIKLRYNWDAPSTTLVIIPKNVPSSFRENEPIVILGLHGHVQLIGCSEPWLILVDSLGIITNGCPKEEESLPGISRVNPGLGPFLICIVYQTTEPYDIFTTPLGGIAQGQLSPSQLINQLILSLSLSLSLSPHHHFG